MDKSKFHSCEAIIGDADISFKDSLEQREWTKFWPDGIVTYRLNNFSDDFSKRWQYRVITDALMFWQWRIKKIKFKRVRDPLAQVDMNISWKPLSFFSSKNALAHAWYPGQGEISGDVEINDEWDYRATVRRATLSKPPLLPIMIHEFGHSIGLTHDVINRESIMYPSFDLGKKKTVLGPVDVERIQIHYGARTRMQRMIDIWRKRAMSGSRYQ